MVNLAQRHGARLAKVVLAAAEAVLAAVLAAAMAAVVVVVVVVVGVVVEEEPRRRHRRQVLPNRPSVCSMFITDLRRDTMARQRISEAAVTVSAEVAAEGAHLAVVIQAQVGARAGAEGRVAEERTGAQETRRMSVA